MLDSVLTDRLQDAVLWAAELHQGQWRDGETPVPYLCHPLEVLGLVRYVGRVQDGDVLVAAVLHDVVEETTATLAEIEGRYGPNVSGLVRELTRTEPTVDQTSGLTSEEVWSLRSEMLLDEIGRMGARAGTVKLADRISNLREARYAKKGKKLARYVAQSWKILDTVPKSVNPDLWRCLKEVAESYGKRGA